MSGDEWLDKIKKMKEETENEIKGNRVAEKELREKHESEIPKIKGLLRSELEKVKAIYINPSLPELDQPKVEDSGFGACLRVPIVESGTHIGLKICFNLQLTENGYGLKVIKEMYDGMYEQLYETSAFIPPQISVEAIQKEITDFLEARNNSIKRMEEKHKRFRREFGYS